MADAVYGISAHQIMWELSTDHETLKIQTASSMRSSIAVSQYFGVLSYPNTYPMWPCFVYILHCLCKSFHNHNKSYGWDVIRICRRIKLGQTWSSKNSYIMRIESMYVSIQGTSNLIIIELFENIIIYVYLYTIIYHGSISTTL